MHYVALLRRRKSLLSAALLLLLLLSAGHATAVAQNLFAWGYNYDGELGNGTFTTTGTQGIATPAAVTGLSGVVSISAGVTHGVALKSDGTVWAWGGNGLGQLGNGAYTGSATPVPVPGVTGVVAVAAGGYHSLALKSDGTVWASS
jgi:alpha-tubulin suppressor-like RCC1 family protein